MSDLLSRMLLAEGIAATDDQKRSLELHLAAVLETNRSFNLTRITDYDQGVRLHVIDSLLILPEVDAAPAGELVDIGSGAGYPAIPLAIMSNRRTTLVESIAKKASFLEDLVGQLGMGDTVRVLPSRSEEVADSLRGSASVVTARAVASLDVLVELAAPILAKDGLLVAPKGKLSDEERHQGLAAAAVCGLEEREVREYELPGAELEHRSVVVYQRVGEAAISLPRRPGIAKKRPLGR